MKLSVIIPVYNEAKSVLDVIGRVKNCGVADLEIVVVDDCSTDGTREKLMEVGSDIRVVRHEANRGKGAAIRTAQAIVTGDAVVIQDADMEYDPREFPRLLKVFKEEKADAVLGSRYFHTRNGDTIIHWLGNKFFTLLSNLLSGTNLTDMETCYKMLRVDLFKSFNLECNRFGFEPEIVAKLAKKSAKIVDTPISYVPRSSEEGKKIGFSDGLAAVWFIFKYNLFS